MKKILFFCVLVFSVVFVLGCTQTTTLDGKTVVKTTDGKTTVTAKEGSKGWCQTGAEWNADITGKDGAKTQMIIKGLVTSGKYKGLCHITYKLNSKDTNTNMDFYYNEDGKTGYVVADMNGQRIEQSISS